MLSVAHRELFSHNSLLRLCWERGRRYRKYPSCTCPGASSQHTLRVFFPSSRTDTADGGLTAARTDTHTHAPPTTRTHPAHPQSTHPHPHTRPRTHRPNPTSHTNTHTHTHTHTH